ncbi:MAG: MarR family transcriptional regulator [Hamadaea sp.]|nr:MarR family transcriptional regulator [Hamadaea sp.]
MSGDNEDFAGALIRLSLAVQHVFTDVSRAHELTAQQALLMCALMDEPLGMAGLTDHLHIEKSTLTGLVDRVERRGYVRRTPDSCDRRAVKVELTPTGREAATGFHDALTKVLADQLEELPPKVRQQMRAAIGPVAMAYWQAVD